MSLLTGSIKILEQLIIKIGVETNTRTVSSNMNGLIAVMLIKNLLWLLGRRPFFILFFIEQSCLFKFLAKLYSLYIVCLLRHTCLISPQKQMFCLNMNDFTFNSAGGRWRGEFGLKCKKLINQLSTILRNRV